MLRIAASAASSSLKTKTRTPQSLFFFSTQTTTLSSNPDPKTFTLNYLTTSFDLTLPEATSISHRLTLRSTRNPESVITNFRNHGFSAAQITQLIKRRPQFLTSDFRKTLLPKLSFFASIGLSQPDLAKVVATNPTLLCHSLDKQIVPVWNFIRGFLSEKDSITMVKRGSRIFAVNQETVLVPNLEFLISSGVSRSCISLLLTNCTYDLLVSHATFARAVVEVKEMGFDMESSRSLWAIRALCRKEKMGRCREIYMGRWGWSEEDVRSAFMRFPPCMLLDEKKLMRAMEFLVEEMGFPRTMIVKCPNVLSFSLERRVIPRCRVLKLLCLKSEKLSFHTVIGYLEKNFLEKFVTKNLDRVPQLLDVYRGKVDVKDAKVLVP